VTRVLAIDYGTRRTGTALSDETRTIASPLQAVEVRGAKQLARELAELALKHGAGELVLGLPLALDGGPGEHAAAVEELAQRLRGRLKLPLHLLDERYTTAQAERALHQAGRFGRALRQAIDCAAATVLLQSFLDRRQGEATAERAPLEGEV
jgi:putative pre-16S rRNA nuclease